VAGKGHKHIKPALAEEKYRQKNVSFNGSLNHNLMVK
jgi:hypothetical protein